MLTIAGHSIDRDDLQNCIVFDVGCLGYDFAMGCVDKGAAVVHCFDLSNVHRTYCKHSIYSQRIRTHNFAIAGRTGVRLYRKCDYRKAWRLDDDGDYPVQCKSVADAMSQLRVDGVDVLKLDCEGAEIEIMPALPLSVRQVSVEFHLHCGQSILGVDTMVNSLTGWRIVQHQLTQRKQGELPNYWDSVFVRC